VDPYSLIGIGVIIAALLLAYLRRYPLAQVLVLINLGLFLLTIISDWGSPFYLSDVQRELAFRPRYIDEPTNWYTVLTHMFVHADLMHVLFNMVFLMLIGVPLEERIGRRNFAICFFVPGMLALALEATVRSADPGILILGASGAVAGTMGALLFLYPKDEIPMFLGFIFLPRVPVWISVGAWFAIQAVSAFTLPIGIASGTIAYAAHIGGFVAGMGVAFLLPGEKEGDPEDEMDLEDLATTDELRDIKARIEIETEPDVRRVWLERFVERSSCPVCGSRPVLQGNRIKCACGWERSVR
jgi:membrane associated rhomboid family serine protease